MPSRAVTQSQPFYDDDTDEDYKDGSLADAHLATPFRQQGLKKRLSESHLSNRDVSRSDRRQKVKNINDDVAEKRSRRKSMKPSSDFPPSDGVDLDNPSNEEQGRSGAISKPKDARTQLTAVENSETINVPIDVMSSNFEEWMKMATDNKINAANSWNFALIDYFHDMSLLRNTIDNSIDFLRASCTLDGCIKIWTSRVDSVGTETGKLLSNLANERAGGDNDDEDGDGSENGDSPEDPSQPRKHKKSHRSESTLAKPEQIAKKEIELDFNVDPLFRKTCADFDEGGAQGLLMNHLGTSIDDGGGIRVIFDASDSVAKGADDEDESEEPEQEIDIGNLRQEFLGDLDELEGREITWSLRDFSFQKNAFDFTDVTLPQNDFPIDNDSDHDDAPDFGGDADMPVDDPPTVQDFFSGDQGGLDDYAGGDDAFPPEDHDGGIDDRPAPLVDFDPRKATNNRELVVTMQKDGEAGMLDYFDSNVFRNWAGPEHWKLRRTFPKKVEGAEMPKSRKEKKNFQVDFVTAAEKDLKTLSKELFAPIGRGASINLPATTSSGRGHRAVEKKDDHQLPNDMHFSSRELVTLFLKPKFSLRMRGKHASFDENGDGEVDENFWAQAAADKAAGPQGGEDDDDGNIAFNTQFFHADYEDASGLPDDDDDPMSGAMDLGEAADDLLASGEDQRRRVRPEFVNYAKRAKRVDVRKLKENIWKGLDIKPMAEDSHDKMNTGDDDASEEMHDARTFGTVITDLQKSYPREKMEEISTSFCFICLLHLANEQGLRISTNTEAALVENGSGVLPSGLNQSIGNIWNLKVSKDPDVTVGAA